MTALVTAVTAVMAAMVRKLAMRSPFERRSRCRPLCIRRGSRPGGSINVNKKVHERESRRDGFRRLKETSVDTEAYACWMAESNQLPPGARMKVHSSVASCGVSLPSTTRPVERSTVRSTMAKRMATVA